MVRQAILVFVTMFLLARPPISLAQDNKAGKRPRTSSNRRVFVPLDFKQMFMAGPLSDPQPPSTLLPAGATTVELALRASVPTSCRYSIGRSQPLDQMIAFEDRQPSTSPRTVIRGLNPDPVTVNDVYIRCTAAPDVVLHLQYRCLPAAKPGFPRVANLWGSWHFVPKGMAYASRIDLWLGAHFTADQIREMRRLNPNCFILTSINTVENNDVPDEYFLRDTTGQKIEVWPGAYRLNLTRPEVAQYQARYAYQKMIESGLMYDGCFFDNFMMSQRWLTHDIYDQPVQLDADGDGQPDDKDAFDKAWRNGVFLELQEWRKLMPWALTSGHSQGYPYPEIAEIFNGQGIGFYTTDVIEGKKAFYELWDYYSTWCTVTVKPAITSVESAVPDQIAYGYDYSPQKNTPTTTWDFDRNQDDGAFTGGSWHDSRDCPGDAAFWTAHILGAWQPKASKDGDNEDDVWGAQAHTSDNYAAIYVEACREGGGLKEKATAHEVGHTGNLDDQDNSTCTCLMARPTFQNPIWGEAFCDQCLAAIRNDGSW